MDLPSVSGSLRFSARCPLRLPCLSEHYGFFDRRLHEPFLGRGASDASTVGAMAKHELEHTAGESGFKEKPTHALGF